MERGAFIAFLVIVISYVGLEVYGVYSQRHLMQPDYIHPKYAAAQRAMERCGEPSSGLRTKFAHNLEVMERRARQALAEERPEAAPAEVAAEVAERAAARVGEVDRLIESEGCAGSEVWTLMKTFEQKARLNLN